MHVFGRALLAMLVVGLAARPAIAGTAASPPESMADASHLVRLADGRRLNLRCVGEGSPTVMLEAGLIGWSVVWHRVQAPWAARAAVRVCAYDRAGMGESDEASEPRSIDRLAADLGALIEAASIEIPVVLVGHSLGGLIVRRLAERHAA